MSSEHPSRVAAPNLFNGTDVAAILRERGWATPQMSSPQLDAWCARAAALLGSRVADRVALADLLSLIFHYDAAVVLQPVESHAVLARYGARDVVRRLAFQLLDGRALDSERFKEIINVIKETSDLRSRDLFLPIRLALAGKAGDGDSTASYYCSTSRCSAVRAPVKSACARILEFCTALD